MTGSASVSSPLGEIKAILFDKDGTLIDFEVSFAQATLDVIRDLSGGDPAVTSAMANAVNFDHHTLSFAPDSVVIAGTAKEIADCWRPFLGPMLPEDLGKHVDDLYAVHTLEGLAPFPGLGDILQRLASRGYVLGIATNDAEANAREQMVSLGLDHLFAFIAGYDSGHGAKPGPGMVLGFCEQADLDVREVMMVGDSLHDMEAGARAGAMRVAVTSGPATEANLRAHADYVLDGISDLEALLGALEQSQDQ